MDIKKHTRTGQKFLVLEGCRGLACAAYQQNDLQKAVEQVNRIMEHIEEDENLYFPNEPLQIYLDCMRILQAVEDKRANKLLLIAHQILEKRAATISDKDKRRFYLEHVPWNREIVEVWRKHPE